MHVSEREREREREREVVTAMMCSTPLRFPILPYPGSRRYVCVCVCVCVCVSAFTLYSLILGVEVVKSSQVTFIYIALLTIQIVSKHLTVSSWRIECQ